MIINKFDAKICRENVLNLIDCFEDSPIYEEVVDEYETILKEANALLKPQAVLEVKDADALSAVDVKYTSQKVIYAVQTVGKEISDYVSSLFQSGNYLAGMVANAMADDMLFQMDKDITVAVKNICKAEKKGVSARCEAPKDMVMEAQRIIVDATNSTETIGVDATSSYMLNPVKSTAGIYLLDDSEIHMNIEHDCSTCPRLDCKQRSHRQINITVIKGQGQKDFQTTSGSSLLEMLKKDGCYIPAHCNGKGICGKCKVKIIKGNIPISKEDEMYFGRTELDSGYRLACTSFPRYDCIVEIPLQDEVGAEILVEDNIIGEVSTEYLKKEKLGEHCEEKGVVVDIGTTTIAMQLVSLETGEVENTFTTVNKQRAYGADVISRIEASVAGKGEVLRTSIREDLLTGIIQLTDSDTTNVSKVIIGANTTMIHLLMGYDCDTLGVSPFIPVNIKTIHTSLNDLLGTNIGDTEVIIYPGISTYVGGDIVSGLFALGFEKKEKVSVLIDLGTNGEMAIGNKDKLLVTSTAAGPAFEGGNITCGVASIPGAICAVDLHDCVVKTKTIGNKMATGICGTGVIETVAELLKNELVDETGLFDDEYFDEGFSLAKGENDSDISIYQKDIREIQLAKSAIRAGFETLVLRYGISYDKIEHIYIAGGFGYKMNIPKALAIGLLPEELEAKIQAVGNACLKGTYKYLLRNDSEQICEKIINSASEVQLSNDKDFNELYVEYMCFD